MAFVTPQGVIFFLGVFTVQGRRVIGGGGRERSPSSGVVALVPAERAGSRGRGLSSAVPVLRINEVVEIVFFAQGLRSGGGVIVVVVAVGGVPRVRVFLGAAATV